MTSCDIIGALSTIRSTADRLDELHLSGHAADLRAAADALEPREPREAMVVRLPARLRPVGSDWTGRTEAGS